MKPTPTSGQVSAWWSIACDGEAVNSLSKFAELSAQWGVEMALKSHYATVKEPELPNGSAVSCKCSICGEWQRSTESGMVCRNGHGGVLGINVRTYTAAQMHDHFTAGVRSGAARSQWQPIETAPKDGRSFDVWVKSTKNPDYGVRMTGVYYVQGVLCGSKFPNSSWCEYASHWMPLPAPPAMQGDNHE